MYQKDGKGEKVLRMLRFQHPFYLDFSENCVIFVVENKYVLMKTFKEYYDKELARELDWLGKQDKEWWKPGEERWLGIKGEYPSNVQFLTIDEKNDVSLFHNHTNVRNSEWSILFSMLGQALVDWCREKGATWEELWCYSFSIRRDGENITLGYKVKMYDEDHWEYDTDPKRLEHFKGLDEYLKEMVFWFFNRHEGNVPTGWNWFGFGLDSLSTSVAYGEWVPASDGSMNLGNYNEETKEYIEYVECM